MKTSILVVLLTTFSFSRCGRLKCDAVCPTCAWFFDKTMDDISIDLLKAGGPSDGVCRSGYKWIQKGSQFGFNTNACCCVNTPPFEECSSANDPRICAATPESFAGETVYDYFMRTGAILQGVSPEDGCCPSGAFKYVYPKSFTGQPKDVCTCTYPSSYP